MHMRDHFALLARYHVWASDRLLDHIAAVSDEHYRRDCGLFFKSMHGTLNHMLVGELNWHARFTTGASTRFQLNQEVEEDRLALAAALRQAVGRWATWIETMPAIDRDGDLHYTRIGGDSISVPYRGALAHVFNHGTHHRGQLTAALTALAYACPELDLVYMLLEQQKK